MLIALLLHGAQFRVAAYIENRCGRQGADAVQFTKRPEHFIVGEGVFITVVIELFPQRHQQLTVFIFCAADYTQAVDEF